MSRMILYTLLIMGATFIIGFAVAYIIKFISATLNYFEHFSSLSYEVAKYKRLHAMKKNHRQNLHKLLQDDESKLNNGLIDFHYSCNEKPKDYDLLNENELIRYSHGEN